MDRWWRGFSGEEFPSLMLFSLQRGSVVTGLGGDGIQWLNFSVVIWLGVDEGLVVLGLYGDWIHRWWGLGGYERLTVAEFVGDLFSGVDSHWTEHMRTPFSTLPYLGIAGASVEKGLLCSSISPNLASSAQILGAWPEIGGACPEITSSVLWTSTAWRTHTLLRRAGVLQAWLLAHLSHEAYWQPLSVHLWSFPRCTTMLCVVARRSPAVDPGQRPVETYAEALTHRSATPPFLKAFLGGCMPLMWILKQLGHSDECTFFQHGLISRKTTFLNSGGVAKKPSEVLTTRLRLTNSEILFTGTPGTSAWSS